MVKVDLHRKVPAFLYQRIQSQGCSNSTGDVTYNSPDVLSRRRHVTRNVHAITLNELIISHHLGF